MSKKIYLFKACSARLQGNSLWGDRSLSYNHPKFTPFFGYSHEIRPYYQQSQTDEWSTLYS